VAFGGDGHHDQGRSRDSLYCPMAVLVVRSLSPPSPDLMLPLLILPFVGLDLLLATSRRRRSRFMRTAHDHRRWHL